MPGQLGTRSELIRIPGSEWTTRGCGVSPADIAAIALAIERRWSKGVPLPNEANRYAVVCDRLSEIALELLDLGVASRIWKADIPTTALWATLSYDILNRVRRSRRSDPAWNYLPRLRSTFVPPTDAAGVARCLDLLAREESIEWPDRLAVVPILEARRDACSKTAAEGSGLVEVVKLSVSATVAC